MVPLLQWDPVVCPFTESELGRLGVQSGTEQSNGRGWVQVVQGHSNKATPKLGSRDLVNHILTSTGLTNHVITARYDWLRACGRGGPSLRRGDILSLSLLPLFLAVSLNSLFL